MTLEYASSAAMVLNFFFLTEVLLKMCLSRTLAHGHLSTGERGATEDARRWRCPQPCPLLPALTLRPRAEAATAPAAGKAPPRDRGPPVCGAGLAARGLRAAPSADRGRGCAAAAARAASLLRRCRERALRCGRHGGQRGLGSVCRPPP